MSCHFSELFIFNLKDVYILKNEMIDIDTWCNVGGGFNRTDFVISRDPLFNDGKPDSQRYRSNSYLIQNEERNRRFSRRKIV